VPLSQLWTRSAGATPVLFIALSSLLLQIFTGAALACEAPDPTSGEVQSCLLIEQGIRANFEGRLRDADAIWKELRALDPEDPRAALYEIETAWWRNIYDEGDKSRDELIRSRSDEAKRLSEARLKSNPNDAIALCQLGEALLHRTRLEGTRGNFMTAGSLGRRGREALERALELRPDMTDIKFQLGLYNYYASVLPRLLRWMSFLWFVPTGDRATGIAYLEEVRASNGRHSLDARFTLMSINTYHGPMNFPSALESGRALHARFPGNTLIHSKLIEVLSKAGHYDEAIREALILEGQPVGDAAAAGRPALVRVLRAQATLLSGRTEEAERIIAHMTPEDPNLVQWGGALLLVVRGQIHDTRGERSRAVGEYEKVLRLEGPRRQPRATMLAKIGLEAPFSPATFSESPMVAADD
jgi:tetratricopeptide (TPR) repeat protein